MKKGYIVENICHIDDYDIILVDNYNPINKITNYWYKKILLEDLSNAHTIGVWKIKNKN